MTPIGRLRTLALVNVALVAAACDPPTRASSLSLTPAQYEILFRGDRVVSVFSSQGCTTIPGPGFVNAYVLAHLDLTVVDGVWRGRPQSDADGAFELEFRLADVETASPAVAGTTGRATGSMTSSTSRPPEPISGSRILFGDGAILTGTTSHDSGSGVVASAVSFANESGASVTCTAGSVSWQMNRLVS